MADPVANFAYGNLDSTGMTSVATSFNFMTGEGSRFPATSDGAYNVVIYDKMYGSAAVAYQAGKAEIVRINTLSTDAVSSCTRAQEGTTALDFTDPLKIYRVERNFTAKDFTDLANSFILGGAMTGSAITGTSYMLFGFTGANTTTQANVRYYLPTGTYVFSNLVVQHMANSITASTLEGTLRINGSTTLLTATSSSANSSTMGFSEDTTNTATCTGANNYIDLQVVLSAGGSSRIVFKMLVQKS
jgi:hypothetical protein